MRKKSKPKPESTLQAYSRMLVEEFSEMLQKRLSQDYPQNRKLSVGAIKKLSKQILEEQFGKDLGGSPPN